MIALSHPARIGRLVLSAPRPPGAARVTVAGHGSCVSIRRRSRDLRSGGMRRWGQDRGLRLFARLHLVMIWVLTGCSGWAAATRSMRYLSFIRLCGGLVLLSRSPAFQGRRAAHAAHDDPGCLQRLGDPLARRRRQQPEEPQLARTSKQAAVSSAGARHAPGGLSAQDGAGRGEPLLPQAVPARAKLRAARTAPSAPSPGRNRGWAQHGHLVSGPRLLAARP